jgi:23S rRNA pseudouridine1911/1915/1917 synthase
VSAAIPIENDAITSAHAGASAGKNYQSGGCPDATGRTRVAYGTSSLMQDAVWTVARDDEGTRLDKFLAHPSRLGSRARAAEAIERGKVYLNEVVTNHAAVRLTFGTDVRVWMDKPGSARRAVRSGRRGDLDIVYEDDTIVVVSKPAGVLTVPLERKRDVPSVSDLIETHLRSSGKRKPFVVHRIDQDTSGLVLFAKDPEAQRQLQTQFKRREPERIYWAVVYGHPAPPSGVWRNRLVWDRTMLIQKDADAHAMQGRDAISDYRTLESFQDASLLEIRLRTGRRNQVRIQAHLHGHPLLGEQRYTAARDALPPIRFGRHALHAHRLSFRHPLDDRLMRFEATPPNDFLELLARLRRRRSAFRTSGAR